MEGPASAAYESSLRIESGQENQYTTRSYEEETSNLMKILMIQITQMICSIIRFIISSFTYAN